MSRTGLTQTKVPRRPQTPRFGLSRIYPAIGPLQTQQAKPARLSTSTGSNPTTPVQSRSSSSLDQQSGTTSGVPQHNAFMKLHTLRNTALAMAVLAITAATACNALGEDLSKDTDAPTHPATSTLTPRPTHTPDPTPTPSSRNTHLASHSAGKHQDLKQLMLRLTNQHRIAAGVPAVTMGRNSAAQLHVEAALDGCYTSHWDRWGLKPNHRYTLAGGTGADGENWYGLSYCIKPSDNYPPIPSMEQEVRETVQGWMDSPGHRRILLDPAYTELNIGIAYDRYNTVMVQQFASNYVQYRQRPTIDGKGTLTLSATVSGATLLIGGIVNVEIAYDPPPKELTRGQLTYTYVLCDPTPVAYVVEPAPPGWRFAIPEVITRTIRHQCVDPYETPANRPAPEGVREAHRHWSDATKASAQAPDVQNQMRRIVAQNMTVTVSAISVKADISKVLKSHGPGIYTVLLWGRPNHMAQPTRLSQQAIFWKTTPPPTAPY